MKKVLSALAALMFVLLPATIASAASVKATICTMAQDATQPAVDVTIDGLNTISLSGGQTFYNKLYFVIVANPDGTIGTQFPFAPASSSYSFTSPEDGSTGTATTTVYYGSSTGRGQGIISWHWAVVATCSAGV